MVLRLALIFLLTCIYCPCSESGWSVSVKGGTFIGDDDNMGHKPNFNGSLSLEYLINKRLGIELETSFGRFSTIRNKEYPEVGRSAWNESCTTINLLLYQPINKKLTLYGIYGYGRSFFFNKDMNNETIVNSNSRAVKYGVGIEWKFNKKLSLVNEVGYHYSDTGSGSSVDSWGWLFSGGLKYIF